MFTQIRNKILFRATCVMIFLFLFMRPVIAQTDLGQITENEDDSTDLSLFDDKKETAPGSAIEPLPDPFKEPVKKESPVTSPKPTHTKDDFDTLGDIVGTSSAAREYDDTNDRRYVLQRGDRISVKIYPEDEYFKSGEFSISPEGNIMLPLLGKVQIADKTISEAESYLTEVLDRDYIVEPEIVIEVHSFKEQSVVILGQVRSPGTVKFPPGVKKMTLIQLISLSGGFTEIANTKKIKIMRRGAGDSKQVIRANAEEILSGNESDVELASGDVVHVAESLF